MSMKNRHTKAKGFTLMEMVVTTAIATVVMLGIGFVVADSQNSWNTTYNKMYADVVTDGFVARRIFDAVIRRASWDNFLVGGYGEYLEVYYYSTAAATSMDRYARFCTADGALMVEYGTLSPKQTVSTYVVCENVYSCVFNRAGRSAQMVLTLDDGSQTTTIASSAIMHNQ